MTPITIRQVSCVLLDFTDWNLSITWWCEIWNSKLHGENIRFKIELHFCNPNAISSWLIKFELWIMLKAIYILSFLNFLFLDTRWSKYHSSRFLKKITVVLFQAVGALEIHRFSPLISFLYRIFRKIITVFPHEYDFHRVKKKCADSTVRPLTCFLYILQKRKCKI